MINKMSKKRKAEDREFCPITKRKLTDFLIGVAESERTF